MSEAEFWRTTPSFIHARIQAKKSQEQTFAELARAISYFAAHSGRIKPTPNIKKFWPLPWDKKVVIKDVDIEAAKPLLDAMDKALAELQTQTNGTN